MKTAVIYYSFDGNCTLIAEDIRTALKADVFKIKLSGVKKRRGFAKFMQGMLLMIKKPEPLPLSVDISTYDLIVLGAPVWGGSPASPIVSFLKKTKITGKKIALFCCHGGNKGRTFEKFRELLSENTIAGEIDFKSPARQESAGHEEKIAEWVKGFN